MPHQIGNCFAVLALLFASAVAQAQLPWSADTHDIAFGDFNGDGSSDLLYIAKRPGDSSGIAFSDSAGPYGAAQVWPANHLGISWQGGLYEPVVGDFNGDGRADLLLQRKTPGNHYLLLANAAGQIMAISQTIPATLGGQSWSADSHRIVTGDFNGDGRSDLFLQAAVPHALNALYIAEATGTFSNPQQTWANAHLGFRWSLQNAMVHAGDFDGDGRADLLVQAKPDFAIMGAGVSFPVPVYLPGRFGIAAARPANGSGEIFYAPALQAWDRDHLGVDWSAANYHAVVGDFSGDGRADILLQGRRAGSTNGEFLASSNGQVSAGNALTDPLLLTATADKYRLFAADFDGLAGTGIYLQASVSGGTSAIAWNDALTEWTERYEYDALGRLRKVMSANGTTVRYSIDRAGNRTAVQIITP